MLNNSPALYRNICSTCVQILGDVSVWTPKICFSEVGKHVLEFKSLFSPTSFLTIKVNFDKIQFEGCCIYRHKSSLWWKYILLTSKRFLGPSLLLLDDYLCNEKNENTGKKIVGYGGLSIKIDGGSWLTGHRCLPFGYSHQSPTKQHISTFNVVLAKTIVEFMNSFYPLELFETPWIWR